LILIERPGQSALELNKNVICFCTETISVWMCLYFVGFSSTIAKMWVWNRKINRSHNARTSI
jgi:hypothetical protein